MQFVSSLVSAGIVEYTVYVVVGSNLNFFAMGPLYPNDEKTLVCLPDRHITGNRHFSAF